MSKNQDTQKTDEFEEFIANRFSEKSLEKENSDSITFSGNALYEVSEDENLSFTRDPKLHNLKKGAQINMKEGDILIADIFKEDRSLAKKLFNALYEVYKDSNITGKKDGSGKDPKLRENFYIMLNDPKNEKIFNPLNSERKKKILKIYEKAIEDNRELRDQRKERFKLLSEERQANKRECKTLIKEIGSNNKDLAMALSKAFFQVYDNQSIAKENANSKNKKNLDDLLSKPPTSSDQKDKIGKLYEKAIQHNENIRSFITDFMPPKTGFLSEIIKPKIKLSFDKRPKSDDKAQLTNRKQGKSSEKIYSLIEKNVPSSSKDEAEQEKSKKGKKNSEKATEVFDKKVRGKNIKTIVKNVALTVAVSAFFVALGFAFTPAFAAPVIVARYFFDSAKKEIKANIREADTIKMLENVPKKSPEQLKDKPDTSLSQASSIKDLTEVTKPSSKEQNNKLQNLLDKNFEGLTASLKSTQELNKAKAASIRAPDNSPTSFQNAAKNTETKR